MSAPLRLRRSVALAAELVGAGSVREDRVGREGIAVAVPVTTVAIAQAVAGREAKTEPQARRPVSETASVAEATAVAAAEPAVHRPEAGLPEATDPDAAWAPGREATAAEAGAAKPTAKPAPVEAPTEPASVEAAATEAPGIRRSGGESEEGGQRRRSAKDAFHRRSPRCRITASSAGQRPVRIFGRGAPDIPRSPHDNVSSASG
jgi:hypothetical protein